ncbi:DUF1786 domain-containing protein [Candidatus Bathyarchaeota archaeon]|nr:DUF1786 domain-containing protein [Candidatus Bathyarchaeota archaeon]
MKILAVDIGAGTEDILLYDDRKRIENCVKMILPSPSQFLAAKVGEATISRKDIFVEGDIIGGGAFTLALKTHLERKLQVFMTERTAYTLRNDLDEVRQLGIEIVEYESLPRNFKGERLRIEEINLLKLKEFLEYFGESLLDVDLVAIAVQDHGVSPKNMSDRRFRLQMMKEFLERDPSPESLAFLEEAVPPCFLRMKSAVQASKRQLPEARVLVMDTSPAAILGCLHDPIVKRATHVLVVNVGNNHTMATIVSKGEVVGIMEHHTSRLNPPKIKKLLVDFSEGKVSDEEVFKDEGHGVFFLINPPGFSKIDIVAVTGPNRDILNSTKLNVHFASPAGDMMMTGPIGLIEAVKKKVKN